ncbi:MAG: hypothetical protein HON70_03630 [Lentisphaerae bacterium]|jgi:hypothetical protein|nr:hypothetical protein [Lentisphaerota bacterium]
MNTAGMIAKLVAELSDGPVLPGGIRDQYNVCGKKNCRCKDPENPIPHGPYSMLSWSVSGQSSSLTVAPADRASVEKMVQRFRTLKHLVNQLALGYAKGLRAGGIAKIEGDVPVLAGDPAALKALATKAKRLAVSRDAWKSKAKKRQSLLEKNRITTRDLKKSRHKWRSEAMASRKQRGELECELADARKRVECLTAEVQHLGECVKKKRPR